MKMKRKTAICFFAGSLLLPLLWADPPSDLTVNDWINLGPNMNVDGGGSAAFGAQNTVTGNTNFAVGASNKVEVVARASALGGGLESGSTYGTVVGLYNKKGSNTAGERLYFSVGNGKGGNPTTERRNAFEVYENGDVIVPSNQYGGGGTPRFEVLSSGDVIVGKAQGDISMGDFE